MVAIRFVCLLTLFALSWACEKKKWIGTGDSFMCVCDYAGCDNLAHIEPKSSPGSITTFVTDRDSARLEKKVIGYDAVDYNVDDIDMKINVNPGYEKQEIIGFGVAFTDVGGRQMIEHLAEDLRDRIVQDQFHPTNGLGYTTGRVPIGGTDYSAGPYSYDDVQDDFDLAHWALTDHDWNEKIPFVKRALELNPDLKLFASPWCGPAWLKTNNDHGGLGILKGEPGSKYWQTYARYLVKFFDAYKEQGINFWGFTTQNEPVAGLTPGWGWNALGFNGEMMRDFIKKDLGPIFEAAGYGPDKLKMMVYDDTVLAILPYVRRIGWDPEAKKYVAGVAYHWYDKQYHDYLSTIHNEFPDFFILGTEASEGYLTDGTPHVIHGSWVRAENYAQDIIDGLNNWSSGWTDWQMATGENGEPNWLDATILVNQTVGEYYRQPNYYAMGHFSRFMRPGGKRVHHDIWWSNGDYDKDVKMVAVKNPGNELVFTVLNKLEKPLKLSIEGYLDKPFRLTVGPKSLTTALKQ